MGDNCEKLSSATQSEGDSACDVSCIMEDEGAAARPSPPRKLSPQEMLNKAYEFKQEGNRLYKEKDVRGAMGKYHRAVLFVKGIENTKQSCLYSSLVSGKSESVPKSVKEETNVLKADCYNNLAACLLQQKDCNYDKVLDYCDKVLQVFPDNKKALYRKGIAHFQKKEFDKAMDMFTKAKNADEEPDPSVQRYLSLCEQHLQVYKQKEKEMYRAMFAANNTACPQKT